MKKFLKIWLKHPISVTGMIIALGLAIQTHSFYPVFLLAIPCGFLYVIWELGLFSSRRDLVKTVRFSKLLSIRR